MKPLNKHLKKEHLHIKDYRHILRSGLYDTNITINLWCLFYLCIYIFTLFYYGLNVSDTDREIDQSLSSPVPTSATGFTSLLRRSNHRSAFIAGSSVVTSSRVGSASSERDVYHGGDPHIVDAANMKLARPAAGDIKWLTEEKSTSQRSSVGASGAIMSVTLRGSHGRAGRDVLRVMVPLAAAVLLLSVGVSAVPEEHKAVPVQELLPQEVRSCSFNVSLRVEPFICVWPAAAGAASMLAQLS